MVSFTKGERFKDKFVNRLSLKIARKAVKVLHCSCLMQVLHKIKDDAPDLDVVEKLTYMDVLLVLKLRSSTKLYRLSWQVKNLLRMRWRNMLFMKQGQASQMSDTSVVCWAGAPSTIRWINILIWSRGWSLATKAVSATATAQSVWTCPCLKAQAPTGRFQQNSCLEWLKSWFLFCSYVMV